MGKQVGKVDQLKCIGIGDEEQVELCQRALGEDGGDPTVMIALVQLAFTCSGEPSEIDGSSREDSTALVVKEYVRAGAFDVVEGRKTDDANGEVPVIDGFHDRVTVLEISSKGNWKRKASLPHFHK